MNDEIKEILDYLQDKDNYIEELGVAYKRIYINNGELNLLLNYITNLQQELEEYKDTETYSKRFLYKANKDRLNANLKLVKELEDYKSRCEKANEIAKDLKQFVYDELVDRNVSGATETHDKIINLLNTLNGRSDE